MTKEGRAERITFRIGLEDGRKRGDKVIQLFLIQATEKMLKTEGEGAFQVQIGRSEGGMIQQFSFEHVKFDIIISQPSGGEQ